MAIYQPLQDYLTKQSAASVVLDYPQIERLLGRPLPHSAYGKSKRQWWANTETHSQALAWLKARRKAKLDARHDRVTFTLVEKRETPPIGDIQIPLDTLQPATMRLLEDVAEDNQVELGHAAALLLNQAGRRRREATLDWFAKNLPFSSVSSVDLIREDRDAR